MVLYQTPGGVLLPTSVKISATCSGLCLIRSSKSALARRSATWSRRSSTSLTCSCTTATRCVQSAICPFSLLICMFSTRSNAIKPTNSSASSMRPMLKMRSKVNAVRRCADGRRLISITRVLLLSADNHSCRCPTLALQIAPCQSGGHDHGGACIAQELGREVSRVMHRPLQRARDAHRQSQLVAQERIQVFQTRRTTTQDDRLDRLPAEARAEVIQRLVYFCHQLGERRRNDVEDAGDGGRHRSRVLLREDARFLALHLFGIVHRHVQAVGDRLGDGVAADRHVAREGHEAALCDVDAG